jgi:hypothetical protein
MDITERSRGDRRKLARLIAKEPDAVPAAALARARSGRTAVTLVSRAPLEQSHLRRRAGTRRRSHSELPHAPAQGYPFNLPHQLWVTPANQV